MYYEYSNILPLPTFAHIFTDLEIISTFQLVSEALPNQYQLISYSENQRKYVRQIVAREIANLEYLIQCPDKVTIVKLDNIMKYEEQAFTINPYVYVKELIVSIVKYLNDYLSIVDKINDGRYMVNPVMYYGYLIIRQIMKWLVPSRLRQRMYQFY